MHRPGDQPFVCQHGQRALVFAQPVGQRAIELQPVAVRTHPAVADQVARVLVAEEIFTGRHRPRIELRKCGLELEIEGISGLLVPEQRIVAQHPGVGDRGLQVEPAIGIDGELRGAADFLQHGLDALAIFRDRRAADLHLHDIITAVEIAAHLAAQRRQVLAGIIVAAGGIDEHAGLAVRP